MDPILVADHEPEIRSAVASALREDGFAVESVVSGDEALEKVLQGRFSLLIVEDAISDLTGLELLSRVRQMAPETPLIMTTASGSVSHAVAAMQAGASDYILKPFSTEILKAAVRKACVDIKRTERDRSGSGFSADRRDGKRMIAQSPPMLQVMMMAKNIARNRATVLIQGESGTGKEVLAAFIHHHSGRRGNPFIAVNCAALPDTLAESELFGHEKGAFTGAFSRKAGKFELANRGTLLLDEISEMSFPLQAKLLRVLQEREIDRIGGIRPVPIDTRVIAVSNVDLNQAVEKGTFREDLFYRINVIPISIPPLRERREDIPLLAKFFLEKYGSADGGRMVRICEESIDNLMQYPWKGNVRELENTIERAVLLGDGDTLRPEHLMLGTRLDHGKPGMSLQAGMSVREMEKKLIFHTLKSVDDNRTHAAEMLGISIRTLRNKLREYRESA